MKKTNVFVFWALIIIILLFQVQILQPNVFQIFFKDEQTDGLTQVSPEVDVLIVGNPNQTSEQLSQELESGHVKLLLWIGKRHGAKQAYAFNTLESLARLEKDKLGLLENKDLELQGLHVARYDAAKKVFYTMSASEAQISAIEVSRNYLIGEVLSDPQNFKIPAGMVLFNDGSKKELRMIKMPELEIQAAKLLPEIQKPST